MTAQQLQEFLNSNGIDIKIPEPIGDLYTRYFVETEGFHYDWHLCQSVHHLQDLLDMADSDEFDNDKFDIEPRMTIRSIGLSNNQVDAFRAYFGDNSPF